MYATTCKYACPYMNMYVCMYVTTCRYVHVHRSMHVWMLLLIVYGYVCKYYVCTCVLLHR